MAFQRIYAHLNCSDLAESIEWFEKLFGRSPDARPMARLVEWHHSESSGFQLFENPTDAGHGTLTLIVDGLVDEKVRLESLEMAVAEIEPGDHVSFIRLRDPDKNLVVLAQPN